MLDPAGKRCGVNEPFVAFSFLPLTTPCESNEYETLVSLAHFISRGKKKERKTVSFISLIMSSVSGGPMRGV